MASTGPLYPPLFRGVRQARLAAIRGVGLFAHGVAHFNEALIHAIHDLRTYLDYLERKGAREIPVTGLSLGGYITALLAAVDASADVHSPLSYRPVVARGRRMIIGGLGRPPRPAQQAGLLWEHLHCPSVQPVQLERMWGSWYRRKTESKARQRTPVRNAGATELGAAPCLHPEAWTASDLLLAGRGRCTGRWT
jgi:hypothetical protein